MGSNKGKPNLPGFDKCDCGAYIGPGEIMCDDCLIKAESPEEVIDFLETWGDDEDLEGNFA